MKCGLKTFPLSIDLDDRIKLVEAEYGVKGFAVVIKLYQAIFSRGYYMKWDIDAELLFIRDYCLSEVGRNLVSEIVACCVRRGVFESSLFERHKILTSKRIQETFLTATRRNTEVIFEKDYALPIVYSFIENADRNGKTVNIFIRNADSLQQKKGKEKKGKEIIEISAPSANATFCKPDLEEVKEYISKNNFEVNAELFFSHYESNGWTVKDKAMKDWRASVRVWDCRAKEKRNGQGKHFDKERKYTKSELDEFISDADDIDI